MLGYVLKDAVEEQLVTAVRLAADGKTYLQPELGARLAQDAGGDGLSEREVEVLRMIALGHTNTDQGPPWPPPGAGTVVVTVDVSG